MLSTYTNTYGCSLFPRPYILSVLSRIWNSYSRLCCGSLMSVLESRSITDQRENAEKLSTWHRGKIAAHRTSHKRCLHANTIEEQRHGSLTIPKDGTNWLESGDWTWLVCAECKQEKRTNKFSWIDWRNKILGLPDQISIVTT